MKTRKGAAGGLNGLLAILTLCLPAVANAQYAYDIVNLGSLGLGGATPEAINNAGQITGYSFTSNGVQHAFYYSNGQIHDATPNSTTYTIGAGINDQGQIAVDAYANLEVYNANTQTARITSETGENIINFQGINNNGDVVFTNGGYTGLYHYSNNTFEYTLQNSGDTQMRAINNSGELAGTISQVAGYYKNGVFQKIGAVPGAFVSDAYGINDNGDICGSSELTTLNTHAFLYHNGVVQDLGTLDPRVSSGAVGVNNSDVVVGTSGDQPFVYQNGKMQDLFSLVDPSLGWTDGVASAINNNGWIVGNGNRGAFVAIPRASAVPESGSLLVCGVGIGFMFLAVRRHKLRSS